MSAKLEPMMTSMSCRIAARPNHDPGVIVADIIDARPASGVGARSAMSSRISARFG